MVWSVCNDTAIKWSGEAFVEGGKSGDKRLAFLTTLQAPGEWFNLTTQNRTFLAEKWLATELTMTIRS